MYIYNKNIVEKKLFDQVYVKKLLSVYKRTSPSILYSEFVKIPSKNKGYCTFLSILNRVELILSRTSRDYDKTDVRVKVYNKVFTQTRISGSMNRGNNSVNTGKQDCIDFTHTSIAVLCFDSSEDGGDSLDLDTVKDSDASWQAREVQGDQSV